MLQERRPSSIKTLDGPAKNDPFQPYPQTARSKDPHTVPKSNQGSPCLTDACGQFSIALFSYSADMTIKEPVEGGREIRSVASNVVEFLFKWDIFFIKVPWNGNSTVIIFISYKENPSSLNGVKQVLLAKQNISNMITKEHMGISKGCWVAYITSNMFVYLELAQRKKSMWSEHLLY